MGELAHLALCDRPGVLEEADGGGRLSPGDGLCGAFERRHDTFPSFLRSFPV